MIKLCKNGHEKTPENVDKRNRCKICYHISHAKWRNKNRDKKNKDSSLYYYNNKVKVKEVIERSRLKRQYGITVEDYNVMVTKQNNVCAICGKQETEKYNKLSIDHDHDTGMIRELLCHKCNRGLGSFNDNINNLKRAVLYLDKHNKGRIKLMTNKEYISNCIKTEAPVTAIMKERFADEKTIRLIHGVMGLSTESAELTDALKKHLFYGKPIDIINIFEECGDIFWYLSLICDNLGFSFEDIMKTNIEKLSARYPEKFTEYHAENRDLETERKILEQ